MIQLKSIDFQYPNSEYQLKIEELGFDDNSASAIIGPSGFGKTTLLNLISGISLSKRGTVSIHNTDLHHLNDAERRAFRIRHYGFVFQDFKLLNYLNVLENILLPFRINGVLKMPRNASVLAEELASDLDIGSKMKKYPDKLSQGEKQRVAICRALINKPGILLADEPTGNLDPENKHRIIKVLFEYAKKHKATLITVTHDHELLGNFDRVVDFKDLYRPG